MARVVCILAPAIGVGWRIVRFATRPRGYRWRRVIAAVYESKAAVQIVGETTDDRLAAIAQKKKDFGRPRRPLKRPTADSGSGQRPGRCTLDGDKTATSRTSTRPTVAGKMWQTEWFEGLKAKEA